MIIELQHCDLEIGYIGTEQEIMVLEFIDMLPEISRQIKTGLADGLEALGRGFCRMAKELGA